MDKEPPPAGYLSPDLRRLKAVYRVKVERYSITELHWLADVINNKNMIFHKNDKLSY